MTVVYRNASRQLDGQYIKLLMFTMRKLGVERVELTLADFNAWAAKDEQHGMWAVVTHNHAESIEILCMPEKRADQYAALANAASQGNG